MTRRSVTIRGPLGALVALVVLLLWLFAAFLPAIAIIAIGVFTDSLDDWALWVTLIIAQGLWWWLFGGD